MWSLISVIRLNPFFWVIIAIGIITGYFREALMLFAIVFIHELGHASVAVHYGWKIRKIELLPFGGVAEIEDSGNKPIKQEVLLVLAGPLQHVWMIGASYLFAGTAIWSQSNHELFLWHNLVILCFNLLPVLPLDGGRLVQLWFMERLAYKKAHKSSIFSSVIALCLICIATLFLPFHLNLYVVLFFLVINNYLEWKQRHYRFMRFLTEREALPTIHSPETELTVSPSLIVRDAVNLLRRGHSHLFTMQPGHGQVTEKDVLQALFNRKLTEPIKDLIDKPPRVNSIRTKVQ
ncbi:M50 family metallopeptidase [Alkalicoccobacillus murimartini]|nr:M50 family metallopeptidase [Alkalicoccobacillus murimartini]